jgi:hypothetical protein
MQHNRPGNGTPNFTAYSFKKCFTLWISVIDNACLGVLPVLPWVLVGVECSELDLCESEKQKHFLNQTCICERLYNKVPCSKILDNF